jgi:sulfite reductase (NADPH) hemoprotein beta-component
MPCRPRATACATSPPTISPASHPTSGPTRARIANCCGNGRPSIPEFAFLPRKFKIAVNAAAEDRAVIRAHDIGLDLVGDEQGEIGFRVFVGGGLGRTPILGKLIREFLPRRHLLSYLDAILRLYNRYGRRDNMYKARIKILVQALGIEEFARQVEAEWSQLRDGPTTVPDVEFARLAGISPRRPGNAAG